MPMFEGGVDEGAPGVDPGASLGQSTGTAPEAEGPPPGLSRRCEEAEARAARAARRVEELEAEVVRLRERLAMSERLIDIERALDEAGAIDSEAVRLLVEERLRATESEDVSSAVSEVKSRKPHLFTPRGVPAARASGDALMSAAMAGSASVPGGAEELDEMAERARASGSRRDIARYLQARRGL